MQRAVNALFQSKVLSTSDIDVGNLLQPGIAYLEKDIKLMKLYNKPELVRSLYNNLKAAHLSSGPIPYTDLLPYDQV